MIVDRKEAICKAYIENKNQKNEEKQQQASTDASETAAGKPEKSGPVVTSLKQEKKRQVKEILGDAGESLAFQ